MCQNLVSFLSAMRTEHFEIMLAWQVVPDKHQDKKWWSLSASVFRLAQSWSQRVFGLQQNTGHEEFATKRKSKSCTAHRVVAGALESRGLGQPGLCWSCQSHRWASKPSCQAGSTGALPEVSSRYH